MPLAPPVGDPTPIFEHFRGSYATELLTAAVAHFNFFGRLAQTPLPQEELAKELGLAPRPMNVLITALRAMNLLIKDREGRLALSKMATEHLVPGGAHDVGAYVGLAAQAPGVLGMVERLKTNQPYGMDGDGGTAFIYRDGVASAMEAEATARHFTLALAGRAQNVAPVLASKVALEDGVLLDVAGGSGIYSIAFLERNPKLRAIVFDRPEVLKVAEEMAVRPQVSDRITFHAGDMFRDPLPAADAVLLSNVLHDWDVAECRDLVARCAAILRSGGRLLIHDVFLNDELDGPLPIALYSAALFTLTEGRAYSAAEYREWLEGAGLEVGEVIPTLIHCGVLAGVKS